MAKIKKCFVFILVVFVFMSVSGCQFESKLAEDYSTFFEDMRQKNEDVYHLLPYIEDETVIDDMYLFYSNMDLTVPYYTVYVNCRFSEEKYKAEKKRLLIGGEKTKKNPKVFDYEYYILTRSLWPHKNNVKYMDYSYALFDDKESRIIYVTFYDTNLDGKVLNVPEQYLPKDVVEAIKK